MTTLYQRRLLSALRGCFDFAQHDIVGAVVQNAHYVILSRAKNLKASEAVDGSINLEILRYTQYDANELISNNKIKNYIYVKG